MRVMTSIVLGALLAAPSIAGCARSDGREEKTAAPTNAGSAAAPRDEAAGKRGHGAAAEALRRAGSGNRHVFMLFFNAEDEPTRVAKESLDRIVGSMGRAAEWVAVDIRNVGETAFVNKYNLRSAMMPVVVAFAPNGAVTGGFRSVDIAEEKLRGAIASRGMQECMKALQDKKLVFVCCQGKKTRLNMEAMKGVNEFKADARYAAYTSVVMVDPADVEEKSFLTQLKIDPSTIEAATALLVPPNIALGVTNGATTKASFLALLASASSGCGSGGCGPSGCGPVKK